MWLWLLCLRSKDLDEALQTCSPLLELLDPGVEERVGETLTVSLGCAAITHDDAAEVAPLRHIIRQVVLLTYLPLSLLDAQFHRFHQIQEPYLVALEAVERNDDLRDVVLVL